MSKKEQLKKSLQQIGINLDQCIGGELLISKLLEKIRGGSGSSHDKSSHSNTHYNTHIMEKKNTDTNYKIKTGKTILSYAAFSGLLCAHGLNLEVQAKSKVLVPVIEKVTYSKDVMQNSDQCDEDHSDSHSDSHSDHFSDDHSGDTVYV